MKQLALGHVLGYTALTVILTAGAAQSLAGSNTVFGDDIVDGTITTPDLKDGALSGSKILDNSVTGTDVNEASLVPTCLAGTARVADICYTSRRNPQLFVDALNDCLDEHLRLPSLAEVRMVAIDSGDSSGLLTDVFYDDAGVKEVTIANNTTVDVDLASHQRNYRCVITVGARP